MIEPLFFDTDCISAFLWVDNESILAKLYPGRIVYHDQGTTHVHATNEIIALQRFVAKYPDRSVRKIEKA